LIFGTALLCFLQRCGCAIFRLANLGRKNYGSIKLEVAASHRIGGVSIHVGGASSERPLVRMLPWLWRLLGMRLVVLVLWLGMAILLWLWML
jgi:hypothetical protein